MNSKTNRTLAILRKTKRDKRGDDLVDFISGTELRLWYRLAISGFHARDGLEPTHCGDSDPSTWPEWASELDLRDTLGVRSDIDGKYWVAWALENAVAPGQPFLVGVGTPRVFRSGYEHLEYDVEWDGELIEVRPLPARLVSQRWEHFMRKAAADRALLAQAKEELLALELRDTASMYLQSYTYSTGLNWGMPNGYGIRLCSKVNLGHLELGCGRSDKGDRNEATQQMIEAACKRSPYLSPAIISTLKVRT